MREIARVPTLVLMNSAYARKYGIGKQLCFLYLGADLLGYLSIRSGSLTCRLKPKLLSAVGRRSIEYVRILYSPRDYGTGTDDLILLSTLFLGEFLTVGVVSERTTEVN